LVTRETIRKPVHLKRVVAKDYPLITPDRWLADFDGLDIRPEVRQLVLKANAVRLVGLG
jgi:predicted TIM-barrel fold metal-dependent hydrolase